MARIISVKAQFKDAISEPVKRASRNFTGAMKKMKTGTEKLDRSLSSLKSAVVGLVAFESLRRSFLATTRAASALQEATSKFGTVFAGLETQAESMRKELVDSFLVSRREAVQFLSSVQDILVPMGVAPKVAAKMSGEIVKLAADLGSFNDMPTEQVIRDISSALVGNTETVRKYGSTILVARVRQEAMNLGLVKGKEALTSAAKVQATFNLITQDSTAAIGDVARTSEGWANQVKQLGSNFENVLAGLGNFIIQSKTANGVLLFLTTQFDEFSKVLFNVTDTQTLLDKAMVRQQKREEELMRFQIEANGIFSGNAKRKVASTEQLLVKINAEIVALREKLKVEKEVAANANKKATGGGEVAAPKKQFLNLIKINEEFNKKRLTAIKDQEQLELEQRTVFQEAKIAVIANEFDQERAIQQQRFFEQIQIVKGNDEEVTAVRAENSLKRKEIAQRETEFIADQEALKSNIVQQGVARVLGAGAQLNAALKGSAQVSKGLAIGSAIISGRLAVQQALASPPGPPFTIPLALAVGINTAANIATIKAQKFARGTVAAPGGQSIVGEFGREALDLPRGTRVTNNQTTNQIMRGVTVNATIMPGADKQAVKMALIELTDEGRLEEWKIGLKDDLLGDR